ncbi:hypothetical protein LBMAG42_34100 [Deltaproteobacteria bacterium]|nr:hypothetical protein LBMAG42_34100 [Deltaproteobacteria bacterium]
MGRGRRLAIGLARVLLWTVPVLLAVAMIVGGAGFYWLRTSSGNAWLLAEMLTRVQPTNGAITAEGVETDLLHRLVVRGLEVRDPGGNRLIRVEEAGAELDTLSLLGRTLPVHDLRLTGVTVDVADPVVFGAMWPADPAVPAKPWAGLPFDVLVEHAHLDGSVRVGGFRADALALDVAIEARGKQVSWRDLTLAATTTAGPLAIASSGVWSPNRSVLQAFSGSIGDVNVNRVDLSGALSGRDLALTVGTITFDKDGLAPLVPALATLPLTAPVNATGFVRGTLDHPEVTVVLDTPGGVVNVTGDVSPAEHTWRALVETPSFFTAPVLSGVEAAHLSGRVDATGTGWTWPDGLMADAMVDATLAARGETLVVNGPAHIEAGHVTLTAVAANLGWGRAVASGDVDVLGKAGHFEVERASARLSRFGVGGDAGFAGAVDVAWGEALRVAVRGDVSGAGIVTQGATIVSLTGTVDAGWAGNQPSGSAAFTLGELAWRDRHAGGGEVHVTLGPTIAAAIVLREGGHDVTRLNGTFNLEGRRLSLSEVWLLVAPELELRGEGEQFATLVDGGVKDARLSLRVGDALVSARGGVTGRGRDTLVVDLDAFDLATLDLIAPGKFAGWAGTVNTHVGLVGTLEAPALEGVIQVQGLSLPDLVEGLRAQVAFQGDGHRMHIDGFLGDVSTDIVVLTGDVPLQLGRGGAAFGGDGPLSATITVAPVDVVTLRDLLAGRELPDARVSGELAVSGTTEAPVLRLVSSADIPLTPGGPTARVWLDGGLADGVLSARLVLNQEFQARMETVAASRIDTEALRRWASGEGPRPNPKSLFSEFGGAVLLKQLPIATIRRFVSFRGDIDGALAGAFALSGSPLSPKLQGAINVINARVGQLRVEPATLELMPVPAGYLVNANLGFAVLPGTQKAGAPSAATCAATPEDLAGKIQLTGLVPLDDTFSPDRPGLALSLTGSGVPLAAAEAFVPDLAETSGCLAVGGTIGGTLVDPRLALGIALSNGSSILASLGVRLEDIDIDGRFQDDQLVIDQARLRTSTGRGIHLDPKAGVIEASGTLLLEHWMPAQLNAKVRFDRAWLSSTADRRAQVSGELTLDGKGNNLDVTGNIAINEGYLHLPERFFSGTSRTELHPDIEVIRPGAEVLAVATGEKPPWVPNIRPKLEIDLARRVRLVAELPLQGGYGDLARSLSTMSVEAELDGVVKVTQKAGQLRLTGEVNTERGVAQLFGRPFELTEGTIAFTGADFKQPILALRAIHHSSCNGEAADINVEIGGVPSAPTIEFPTDGSGAFPDTDSVLRALVLGSCEGTGDGAETSTLPLLTELLMRQVASYGASSGESLFHLQKLEVDSTGTARVGFALGRNVFLTYEYDPTAATTGGNTSTVQLELSLPYRWYLAVETGSEGNTAASAYRKWRF